MECPPFAKFLQILINVYKFVLEFCAFVPVGDIMRDISLQLTLHKCVCDDGKEMKELLTANVVYIYILSEVC
jgi:hypothetical protein